MNNEAIFLFFCLHSHSSTTTTSLHSCHREGGSRASGQDPHYSAIVVFFFFSPRSYQKSEQPPYATIHPPLLHYPGMMLQLVTNAPNTLALHFKGCSFYNLMFYVVNMSFIFMWKWLIVLRMAPSFLLC